MIKRINKDQNIDICTSFFLIHEIPNNYKKKVIDNMLINANKKIVFIDYHKPNLNMLLAKIQPVYFRYVEPFA